MFKKVFLVFIIIIAFLAASIYIFRVNIKQYAITTILKSFPLPNVALANVNFDQTTGKLKLEEVKVKNPKGFKNKHIMEADSVDMEISYTTKPDLTLNINNINISSPILYIERSQDNKWNFLEYPKVEKSASVPKEVNPGFIKRAFAAESDKASEILLPRNIYINNGAVHFLDNFVAYGRAHTVDFLPVTGVVSLDYSPEKNQYEKIQFDGSCNVDGSASRVIKGNIEIHPRGKNPSYKCKLNAYNVSLAAIKPYLDRHTPFIVTRGNFNLASNVKSEYGMMEGDHTMELMDLEFAINPRKGNAPFLETSVKKLTLYLTNQRGNVVIDFRQKGRVGGEIHWSLGPIAKRAIGLMAIDTVIDVIKQINKGGEGDAMKKLLPKDVPPEVIDIFRGILQ